jgi:hypothetical protein
VLNSLSITPWRRMGEWTYSSTIISLGITGSGQLHATVDLTSGYRTPVATVYKVGWAQKSMWALWERKNISPARNRSRLHGRPVRNVVTIPTELSFQLHNTCFLPRA